MPGTKEHSVGSLNLFLIIAQWLAPWASSFGQKEFVKDVGF